MITYNIYVGYAYSYDYQYAYGVEQRFYRWNPFYLCGIASNLNELKKFLRHHTVYKKFNIVDSFRYGDTFSVSYNFSNKLDIYMDRPPCEDLKKYQEPYFQRYVITDEDGNIKHFTVADIRKKQPLKYRRARLGKYRGHSHKCNVYDYDWRSKVDEFICKEDIEEAKEYGFYLNPIRKHYCENYLLNINHCGHAKTRRSVNWKEQSKNKHQYKGVYK